MSLSTQRVPYSSSSSTIPSKYDVFLSFRGKDTRNGFADHLHDALKQRGITVFRDDKKLQQGKDISQELFTAIKQSQYAVVIISKNFAFSKWCLRELAQIVECMGEGRLKVLPVFYHVDPSDVRKQKGIFAKAFHKHRENFKIVGRQTKHHRTEMKEVATVDRSNVRRQKRSFEEASNKHRDNPKVIRRQMKSRRTDLKEFVGCAVDPSDGRELKRNFEEASNKYRDNPEINQRQMKSRRTDLKESVEYAVDPSVARNQEMHFVEASASNVDNPETEQEPMKSWRDALEEVGNLCGWHVNNCSEAAVVQQIATEIFCGLRLNLSGILRNLVGVDSKVKELVSLLSLEKDDVRYIGIHGMGGVGKTTLAKVLYSTICCEFEASCFIYGTKDNKSRSIVELQEQIVHEILQEHNKRIWNDFYGTDLLATKLCNKRVLIVFDDINQEQLEALAGSPSWFGGKSRIVITSRDCQFWKRLVNHGNTYEVKLLNHNDALQLFYWNVFGRLEPEENFVELSNKIIGYAGGLPLAIKVIGSSLVCKEMEVWNCTCDYLKANPNAQVLDILEISYNGLDGWLKELFLDIACFYKGIDAHSIILIWKSLDRHPEIGIDILRHKSLLEFSPSQEFQIHDLLQKMGQRIVYRENLREPGKRSRLHCFNDIIHLLKNNSGTNAVKGIVLKFPSRKQELSFEGFSTLTSLEILVIEPEYGYSHLNEGIVWSGCYSKLMLSDELRLLKWWGCPLPFFPRSFQLSNLVRLEIPFCLLKQLWHDQKNFEKLTYINVEWSKDLIELPDFGGAPCLEVINFSSCTSLWKVHSSIGNLRRLQHLSLSNCKSLEELPEEINWESLLQLNLDGCLRLKKLPNLSRVPNVEEINLSSCESLRKLHPSIVNLKRLKHLSLLNCKSLEELPKEIHWESLLRPTPNECLRLKKLPDLSGVPNVGEINLSSCESLRKLPPSIGNFVQLQRLSLSFCKSLEELPKEINWESLLWLDLNGCLGLKKLPNLSRAPNIEKINLSSCESLRELHPSIGNLKWLKFLSLSGCKSLEELPEKINWESLRVLCLKACLRLKKLPNLSGVPNIRKIDLSYCENLEKLHPSIGNLQQLQYLSLSHCKSLKKISKEINCKSLEKLYLLECLRLKKFPKIRGNMSALRMVDLRWTAIKSLPLSFQKLSSLEELLVGESERTEAIQPRHDILRGRTGFCSSNDSNLPYFSIPNWLANFKFLRQLHLQYCNLSDQSFPRDFCVPAVWDLNLSGNRFTRIPKFLNQFPKVENVEMGTVPLKGFRHPRIILNINLSDCNLLYGEIWDTSLLDVYFLHLDKNEFTTLTDNFCVLNPISLSFSKCRQLQVLPKLPLKLRELHVTESPLLELIYDQRDMETSWEALDACVCLWFSAASINCHVTPYKIIQLQPPCPINKVKHDRVDCGVSWGPTIRFEIPEWFQQRSIGLFGKFQSRIDEDLENWLGYALFVVYEVHERGFPEFVCRFHLDDIAREQPVVLHVPQTCSVGANGFWAFMPQDIFSKRSPKFLRSGYNDLLSFKRRNWRVGIKECGFAITSNSLNVEIKECGACVIHKSNVLGFFDVLSSISPHGLELKTLEEFDFHLHVGYGRTQNSWF